MNAVQDRLDLSTDSKSELGYTKDYLKLPDSVTADDDLIGNLIEAAKEDADKYLNNPFTEVRGEIVVGSPADGETIVIDNEEFTKKSSTSVEDREFADAPGLVSCINSDLITVNGDEVGIPYLEATNDTGTVQLKASGTVIDPPEISTSDETELKIQYRKVELTIPKEIEKGVLELVAREYYKRIDGLDKTNSEHGGTGSMSWGEIKREYLKPYRLNPGI